MSPAPRRRCTNVQTIAPRGVLGETLSGDDRDGGDDGGLARNACKRRRDGPGFFAAATLAEAPDSSTERPHQIKNAFHIRLDQVEQFGSRCSAE